MANLVEALLAECTRVREHVLPAYESIGAAGAVGRAFIRADLAAAEKAIGEGDVVAMVNAYQALKDCKG